MALTEGRGVKDGCVEFKEKFVEYTMASIAAWGGAGRHRRPPGRLESVLGKELVLVKPGAAQTASSPAGEPVRLASGTDHQLLLPLPQILRHVHQRGQPGLEHLPVLPEAQGEKLLSRCSCFR